MFTKTHRELTMRTFKKGNVTWQSSDEITIKALLNSGYEEVKETEEVQEHKPEPMVIEEEVQEQKAKGKKK